MDLKKIAIKIAPLIKSKYFLAGFIFLLWITIFDQNNLLDRTKLMKEIKQLNKDREYFQEQIEKDAARLQELKTNDDNLEKFAREQYLMHRENEDVFVIVEE